MHLKMLRRHRLVLCALIFTAIASNVFAEVMVEESYDYAVGAALHGQGGGMGWSDAWTVTSLNDNLIDVVEAPPFSAPQHHLPSGFAGAAHRISSGYATRPLHLDMDPTEETVYYAAIFCERTDYNPTNGYENVVFMGFKNGAASILAVEADGNESIKLRLGDALFETGDQYALSSTHFIVAKIIARPAGQADSLFVSFFDATDDIRAEPGQWEYSAVNEVNQDIATFFYYINKYAGTFYVDEMRLGASWEDVVTVTQGLQDYYDAVEADNPAVWFKLNDKYDLYGEPARDARGQLDGEYRGHVSVFDAGIEKAAWFNGYDGAVELGTGLRGVLDGTAAVTVEAWIRPVHPDINHIYAPILSYRVQNGAAGLDLRLKYADEDIVLLAGVRSCPADSYQTRQVAVDVQGQWHHLVCVIDYANDAMQFYLDGESIAAWDDLNFASNIYTPGPGITQTDKIGADCSETYYYRGFIDELAVYTRALTPTEIDRHFGYAPIPVAYIPWDAEVANNGGADVTLHDLGSPGIIRAPNGDLIATYGHGGPDAPPYAVTTVCRSIDNGQNWTPISAPSYQAKSTPFKVGEDLYLIGLGRGSERDIHIKRSTDNGLTWTATTGPSTGRLLLAEHGGNNYGYHTDNTAMVEFNGRIYKAFEQETQSGNQWPRDFAAFVLSAPVDCDLLNAANWTKSNIISFDPGWVGPDWRRPGWLEGNMVVGPNDQLYLMIRVNSEPYVNVAALLEVSADGATVTFEPQTGFVDFPGGMAKFNVRYDPVSKKFLALVNNNIDPEGTVTQRNMVTLVASDDLRQWDIVKNLVQCDRPISWDESLYATGFQYIDWRIDGDDIVFVSRTAYDAITSDPDKAWHDANRITFHRLENYLDYVAPCGAWGYLAMDLNQDCQVDMNDLQAICLGWTQDYDMADFAMLAAQWLMCTLPGDDGCVDDF